MLRAVWYRLISVLVHQPGVLRAVGRAARAVPALSGRLGVLAGRRAVALALRRSESFSNTAHMPNLIAGEFVMGMDAGPRHGADRAFLQRVLPPPQAFADASAAQSRLRMAALAARVPGRFDLIHDYMVWVAWAAVRQAFGTAAASIEQHAWDGAADSAAMHGLFADVRHVGAYLIGGSMAPHRVQARAARSSAALHARVAAQHHALTQAWHGLHLPDAAALQRNAVGLMWVAHPATVQSVALIMQELLARPAQYEAWRRDAAQLGDRAWADAAWRDRVRGQCMALLRLRPPFPLLTRDAPRHSWVEAAPGRHCPVRAGTTMQLMAVAAMGDGELPPPGIGQGSVDGDTLVFGLGPRACVGADHATEVLVSALTGLLLLPRLRYADGWLRRIGYDGPLINRMALAFDAPARSGAESGG